MGALTFQASGGGLVRAKARPLRRSCCKRQKALASLTASSTPSESTNTNSPPPSRRDFLLSAALSSATFLLPSPSRSATPPPTLVDNVTPVLMCRRLFPPLSRYIDEGQWDKGRTNVNYCTRVLAIRKNMKEAADYLPDDAYYEVLDIMGEIANTMTQLDATLYTPLFIPSDEGVSVEQRKYQNDARRYLQEAVDYVDRFVELIPEKERSIAAERARKAKYEIVVDD